MHTLEGLNPAQREAVTVAVGPLLIVAGPGSGKTRVITQRVAHLIRNEGVSPYRIMAVTFTNKAAREMRVRLEGLVGPAVDGLTMGTFHATCARLLRREVHHLGLDPHFAIYDEDDQLKLVKQTLKELELDEKRFPARPFLNAISHAKSELIGPHEYGEFTQTYWQEVAARVYRRYQELLTRNKAMDFDDLLMVAVQLFRNCEDVAERYRERYLHLLVDEFQDTNVAQYALVKLLGARHRNVCVVGDPDQSIYSWRSADVRNILNFEQDYPDAKVVMLEQNYRSTKTILEAAKGVIDRNEMRKEKDLWTENPRGQPITIHEAQDEVDEAVYAAREIERLVGADGRALRDFAVMYRTNAQSRALEETFIRYGLRYKLVGGTRFYERREVKDVLAYLRLLENPSDGVSLNRVVNVPPRGIGDRTLAEVDRLAKERGLSPFDALRLAAGSEGGDAGKVVGPRARNALAGFVAMVDDLLRARDELGILELLDLLLERTGYRAHVRDGTEEGEERWENVLELRTVARDFDQLTTEAGVEGLLEKAALQSDVDGLREEDDGVTLITLHAAKGLEFPFVFLVGLDDGISPHSRSFDDPAAMEEERRLCYVGMTRAMYGLWMVYAVRRTLYGNPTYNAPSRFLDDVPGHLTSARGWRTGEPRKAEGQRTAGSMQQDVPRREAVPVNRHPQPAPVRQGPPPEQDGGETSFKAGDRVFHPAFGNGVVVASRLTRGDEEVTVAFDQRGVKKLALSFAPLHRA